MFKGKIKTYQTNDKILDYIFGKNIYRKKRTLGEGSFGKVVLVERINPSEPNGSKYFAIKISKRFRTISNIKSSSKRDDDDKPKDLNFIELRELIIMKTISHPNVINLKEYKLCRKDREIWILMDYLPTDLGKFFAKNKDNKDVMNEKFFKNIPYQILNGLNYLHQNLIIHRDLKLENILYDEVKNIAKIADFGLSRKYDFDIETQYTDVGTFPYKPPEVILGLTHYSTEFDIWSVGCLLVEICIGFHLFGEDNAQGVIKLIYKIFGSFNETTLPGFKNFPSSKILKNVLENEGIGLINYIKSKKKFDFENNNFYDLIEKMLCINPTKRINAKDCLSHPWFSNVDKLNI